MNTPPLAANRKTREKDKIRSRDCCRISDAAEQSSPELTSCDRGHARQHGDATILLSQGGGGGHCRSCISNHGERGKKKRKTRTELSNNRTRTHRTADSHTGTHALTHKHTPRTKRSQKHAKQRKKHSNDKTNPSSRRVSMSRRQDLSPISKEIIK